MCVNSMFRAGGCGILRPPWLRDGGPASGTCRHLSYARRTWHTGWPYALQELVLLCDRGSKATMQQGQAVGSCYFQHPRRKGSTAEAT